MLAIAVCDLPVDFLVLGFWFLVFDLWFLVFASFAAFAAFASFPLEYTCIARFIGTELQRQHMQFGEKLDIKIARQKNRRTKY